MQRKHAEVSFASFLTKGSRFHTSKTRSWELAIGPASPLTPWVASAPGGLWVPWWGCGLNPNLVSAVLSIPYAQKGAEAQALKGLLHRTTPTWQVAGRWGLQERGTETQVHKPQQSSGGREVGEVT